MSAGLGAEPGSCRTSWCPPGARLLHPSDHARRQDLRTEEEVPIRRPFGDWRGVAQQAPGRCNADGYASGGGVTTGVYVIRERLFAIGQDSDITDEHGRPVLRVDGKALEARHARVGRIPPTTDDRRRRPRAAAPRTSGGHGNDDCTADRVHAGGHQQTANRIHHHVDGTRRGASRTGRRGRPTHRWPAYDGEGLAPPGTERTASTTITSGWSTGRWPSSASWIRLARHIPGGVADDLDATSTGGCRPRPLHPSRTVTPPLPRCRW